MPTAEVRSGSVSVPWAAWHEDHNRTFEVPSGWRLVDLGMQHSRELTSQEIGAALDRPLGAPSCEALVSAGARIAIAIEDITRPTPSVPVMEAVVDRLAAAGVSDDRITVVIASGAHRQATARDIERKVGSRFATRLRVVCHDPTASLVDTGVSLAGVSVRLNEAFHGADLRIGIGTVMPHPFAAFSGGGKIVIPGLADLGVLERTHKYALMGLRGGHVLAGNRFRSDMEAAVRTIGLHWMVNVVVGARRQIASISAGDLVVAHRAAAEASANEGRTRAPTELLDALLLNAYPKDGELLQMEAAFIALRSGMLQWLTRDAPIVLMGAASEGLGTHGLFGPGGRLFRTPTAKGFLGDRQLIIFCPGVEDADARTVFWSGYPFCSTWPQVVETLSAVLPPSPRVGVVPCGPLQLATQTHT